MTTLWWFVGMTLALTAIGTVLWRRSSLSGRGWGRPVVASFGAGSLIALVYSYLMFFAPRPVYYPPEWVHASMRVLLWPDVLAFRLFGQSHPEMVRGLIPWSIALQLSLIFLAVTVGVRLLVQKRVC